MHHVNLLQDTRPAAFVWPWRARIAFALYYRVWRPLFDALHRANYRIEDALDAVIDRYCA